MPSPFVLLTAPEGDFYAYVLRCFAAGFEALGVHCLRQNPPISLDPLARWAREFRPAAILEINRVLPRTVDWPRGVAHLAWLQDHRFNGEDLTQSVGVSDHLYFIVHPKSFGITLPTECAWSILLPGARMDAPAPSGAEMKRDFSMTGYIPAPLDDDAPVSFMPDGSPVELVAFLKQFPTEVLSDASFSMRDIHQAIFDTCRLIGCKAISDRGTLQTFDEILVRTLERRRILEDVITLGGTLEIFGPATWDKWPQFVPYYRGNITDPQQLDKVYQTTRVNLHNSGLTMHYRVMDCLAAGGFMLINETPWDFMTGGIREYLEPSRHYGAYPIGDVARVAQQYLSDDGVRQEIASQGRCAVMSAHTWRHRAAQVLQDIGLPPAVTGATESADYDEARLALERAARLEAAEVEGASTVTALPGTGPVSA